MAYSLDDLFNSLASIDVVQLHEISNFGQNPLMILELSVIIFKFLNFFSIVYNIEFLHLDEVLLKIILWEIFYIKNYTFVILKKFFLESKKPWQIYLIQS